MLSSQGHGYGEFVRMFDADFAYQGLPGRILRFTRIGKDRRTPPDRQGSFADTVGDLSEDQDCRDVDSGSSAWSSAKLVVQ